MLIDIAVFILGLLVLSWSADRFVFGASAIAQNIGISPLVIGMTIVAMGSSAPEIMVAASASISGSIDTAVGNAIGSNITNIGLVLGITALFRPLTVGSSTIRREMPIVLFVSLIAAWFLTDLVLSRPEGVVLIILFFIVVCGLTWFSIQAGKKDPYNKETEEEVPCDVQTSRALFWVAIGIVLLPLSADLMVDTAVNIARYLGMSELVIGLTIIAIGTSLPELAASIAGVLKGEDDLALGNIIGSNIFNILAVLAMPGLIAPGLIDENAANRDILVMLVFTVLLLLFSFSLKGVRKIRRWEGAVLIVGFLWYLVFLIV